MIECHIIPDGSGSLPVEARDDAIVWSNLQNASPSSESAIGSMHEVERIVSRERLVLRLPGTLADESSSTLDGITNAIVNNISGVKAHPDGWQEVDS